jgi:urease accessory protein
VLVQSTTEPPPTHTQGLADLELAVRGQRTCLVRQRVNPPLVVQRALYLDQALPDMAFIYLANPTAGILQGDHLKVRVKVAPGAKAHLTTQSATKVFAMPDGSALQETELTVEKGAYLEYLPDQVIPFRGAKFSQKTSMAVAPDATLIYGDILAPGRTALGESLAYDCFKSQLAVNTSDGFPIFREGFSLTPKSRRPSGRCVLGTGESPTLGTLLVVAGGFKSDVLRDRMRDCLKDPLVTDDATTWGISLLPAGGGVGLKIMASSVASARYALSAAWKEARLMILGVEPPVLRKY